MNQNRHLHILLIPKSCKYNFLIEYVRDNNRRRKKEEKYLKVLIYKTMRLEEEMKEKERKECVQKEGKEDSSEC